MTRRPVEAPGRGVPRVVAAALALFASILVAGAALLATTTTATTADARPVSSTPRGGGSLALVSRVRAEIQVTPTAATTGDNKSADLARAAARPGEYRFAPQSAAAVADDAVGVVRAGDAGSYAGLQARSVVGDALDLHHMPQAAAGFTSRGAGGAIAMPYAEHVLTRTYGIRGVQSLKADAGLSFRQVLARDIWDVRSIAGSYNQGLRDLIGYYRTNFPELMARGGGL